MSGWIEDSSPFLCAGSSKQRSTWQTPSSKGVNCQLLGGKEQQWAIWGKLARVGNYGKALDSTRQNALGAIKEHHYLQKGVSKSDIQSIAFLSSEVLWLYLFTFISCFL